MTRPMPQCKVCGSSAPITRAHAQRGTLHLCYAHEAVCWPHLADPCLFCDGGEPETVECYCDTVRGPLWELHDGTDAGHAGIILLAALPVILLAVAFVARLLGALAGTVAP